MNRSNNDMERKIRLEKLKKSDNSLVSRTANILSADISDKIISDMRSEWDFCRVDVFHQETEGKYENDKDEFRKQNKYDN